MSKAGFMKDAAILFAITLVSGCLLGGVYQVTKEPIAMATIAANNKAYKAVLNE
ncbi:MAG: electron transporter RnfG, partial [Clostridiales bacterium]|nr:electron transporter RnfG [Clostridiales bacterium]